MGYKRDKKKSLQDEAEWKQWRKEHDNLVTASGLPELVVSDADHWHDFLDNNCLHYHDDPLNFGLEQLSVRQKAFLLQLVSNEADGLNTIVGRSLVADLVNAVKQRYKE